MRTLIKILLSAIFILSCVHKTNQSDLLDKIHEYIHASEKDFIVIVMSASDCSECTQTKVEVLLKKEKIQIPIYGLFCSKHGEKDIFQATLDVMKKNTRVKWSIITDTSLITNCYHLTQDVTGPYILRIKDNVVSVIS